MRCEVEMMDLIQKVAQTLGCVQAIGMNGSRASQQGKKDRYQDYDIVYVVSDQEMEPLLTDRKWVDLFGPRLIMQTPSDVDTPVDVRERFNFLMLFKDGNRIDLGLCPVSKVGKWIKEDPVGIVLWDPNKLLENAFTTSNKPYQEQLPEFRVFEQCVNEFWWVSTYVLKGICREEHLYASDHLYQNCFSELRQLIHWALIIDHNQPLVFGKNDKNLDSFMTETNWFDIMPLLDMKSIEQLSESLIRMQRLFYDYSLKVAKEANFDYNKQEALAIMAYTEKELVRFTNEKERT